MTGLPVLPSACPRGPTSAYLLLFVDRGSGGSPGLVVSWGISSAPRLSQVFDGTEAAILVLHAAHASNYQEAADCIRNVVLELPHFAWLRDVPQGLTTQITRGDSRRLCTWECLACNRLRADHAQPREL